MSGRKKAPANKSTVASVAEEQIFVFIRGIRVLHFQSMLKAISLVGYLAMVGGLLGLLATKNLFSPSPVVLVLQAAASGLMIWARITFGRRSFHLAANPTEGGLVTTGPYRFIRHPIYTGMCLFASAGAAAHLAWSTATLCGLIWAGALLRIFCEERLLATRYPDYQQYAARTSRMLPPLL